MVTEANNKIYFNGVEQDLMGGADYLWSSGTTMDLNVAVTPRNTIAGSGGSTPGSLFYGSLAELVFNDTYLDNPAAFYASGSPVDVGSDGSTPFGSQPVLYFSSNGSGADWTNQGTGGAFTQAGTIGSDTSP
jgi:hypothetical protein